MVICRDLGGVAGSALLFGAAVGYFARVPTMVQSVAPQREHHRAGQKAATIAMAGGAILAMLADTMMPEAHDAAGMIIVIGFLVAFLLSKMQA